MSGLITVAAVRFWSCGSEPRAPPSVWRCLWTVTLKPLHRRDEKKTTPEIVMEDAFFKYSTADWHSSWCRLRWVYKTCLIFFHFKPRIYRLPSQARLHANRDADVESQWGVCSSVLHNKLHTTTHTQTHTHPPAELFREDSTQAMHDHICLKRAFIQALFFFMVNKISQIGKMIQPGDVNMCQI